MIDDDDEVDELWTTSIKPSKQPALVVHHTDKGLYAAFQTQDKLISFVVDCPITKQEHIFFYHHLLYVTADKPKYDYFFFTTTTSVIQVFGRNLQPLINALSQHKLKSMSEFSTELHLQPSDESLPFIRHIKVALIKGASQLPAKTDS